MGATPSDLRQQIEDAGDGNDVDRIDGTAIGTTVENCVDAGIDTATEAVDVLEATAANGSLIDRVVASALLEAVIAQFADQHARSPEAAGTWLPLIARLLRHHKVEACDTTRSSQRAAAQLYEHLSPPNRQLLVIAMTRPLSRATSTAAFLRDFCGEYPELMGRFLADLVSKLSWATLLNATLPEVSGLPCENMFVAALVHRAVSDPFDVPAPHTPEHDVYDRVVRPEAQYARVHPFLSAVHAFKTAAAASSPPSHTKRRK